MKSRAILLVLALIFNSSFVLSQESKDTLQENYIYPQFHDNFSVEESWQIHKEAYKKQLEAKGLSENEINKKMQEYEKQKEEQIARIKEQRKKAVKQRQLAEIQRQRANEQRKMAIVQRQEAELQHQKLKIQRQEVELQRQKANEQRKMADVQRQEVEIQHQKLKIQRQEAEMQHQRADEQRKQAEMHRQKSYEQQKLAEIQRGMAVEQRKEAEYQSKIAEEQRKKIAELKKSIKKLFNENFNMSDNDSEIKSVKIEVTEMNSLFFNIDADINSGSVLIEIFNPNGKKEGELSLEHHRESTPKTATKFPSHTSSSLNKTINTPEIGDWLIKITPEKSNGNINISVAQYMNPNIDE